MRPTRLISTLAAAAVMCAALAPITVEAKGKGKSTKTASGHNFPSKAPKKK